MYQWLQWTSSPDVQQQVAEWTGVAPANPRRCSGDRLKPGFCSRLPRRRPGLPRQGRLRAPRRRRATAGRARRAAPTTPSGRGPGSRPRSSTRGASALKRRSQEALSRGTLKGHGPRGARSGRVSPARPAAPSRARLSGGPGLPPERPGHPSPWRDLHDDGVQRRRPRRRPFPGRPPGVRDRLPGAPASCGVPAGRVRIRRTRTPRSNPAGGRRGRAAGATSCGRRRRRRPGAGPWSARPGRRSARLPGPCPSP